MTNSITSTITASQRAYLNSLNSSVLDVWNATHSGKASLEDIKDQSMTEERLMLALAHENLKKSDPKLADQMIREIAKERLRLKSRREKDPTFKALDSFLQNAKKKGLLSGQKASAIMRYALGKGELAEGVPEVSDKRITIAVQGSGKSNLETCLERTLANKLAKGDEVLVARYLSKGTIEGKTSTETSLQS